MRRKMEPMLPPAWKIGLAAFLFLWAGAMVFPHALGSHVWRLLVGTAAAAAALLILLQRSPGD